MQPNITSSQVPYGFSKMRESSYIDPPLDPAQYKLTSQVADTVAPSPSEKKERRTPALVMAGSLLGTLLPMFLIAQTQGKFKDLKGLQKAFGIFKAEYEDPKNIIFLGGSAVLGGLAGGIIADKGKDTWPKIKEGTYQFITNIAAPVLFCGLFNHGFEKAQKRFPRFGKVLNGEKFSNKALMFLAKTGVSLAGIAVGVPLGAFVSNRLNSLIHKDDTPKRKITVKDFLIQVDDMASGFTVTGALENIPVLKHIGAILPFVYYISGTETGKQTHHKEA